jgi:hypothetical protein
LNARTVVDAVDREYSRSDEIEILHRIGVLLALAFGLVFQLTRIPDTVGAQLDGIVSRFRGRIF